MPHHFLFYAVITISTIVIGKSTLSAHVRWLGLSSIKVAQFGGFFSFAQDIASVPRGMPPLMIMVREYVFPRLFLLPVIQSSARNYPTSPCACLRHGSGRHKNHSTEEELVVPLTYRFSAADVLVLRSTSVSRAKSVALRKADCTQSSGEESECGGRMIELSRKESSAKLEPDDSYRLI